ncbi:MAG TPA: DUF86 domain-containing protein [Thermoanaerobaculia bacterium]|nr:DUF86 domain-containing protein [Thermoanaerobaculia bacterium]
MNRKLEFLRRVLAELRPFSGSSLADVLAHHRQVERIFELLVTAAADLLQHVLSERGRTASSYREAFALAGQLGLIGPELSTRLQGAAKMRNVIVHLYEEINYQTLRDSIDPALADFAALIAAFQGQLPTADE